ncbi:glycosyltransferase family 2 protein [Candidatus Harpocratesius sp.]
MSSNIISIIIPTYKRYKMLLSCLKSIKRAKNVNLANCEVIVVDDGGNLSRSIEKYGEGLNIKWIYLLENKGQANAQKEAMSIATSDIIAFLDDDAEIHPNWINSILKYFKSFPEVSAVLGRILPINTNNLLARTRQQVYNRRHKNYLDTQYQSKIREKYNLPKTNSPGISTHISGGNSAIQRNALSNINEWPVWIKRGADQYISDLLLSKKLIIGYNPEMIIYHHHNPQFSVLYKTSFQDGRKDVALLRRNGKSPISIINFLLKNIYNIPNSLKEFPEMLRADKNPLKIYFVLMTIRLFEVLGQIYEFIFIQRFKVI